MGTSPAAARAAFRQCFLFSLDGPRPSGLPNGVYASADFDGDGQVDLVTPDALYLHSGGRGGGEEEEDEGGCGAAHARMITARG